MLGIPQQQSSMGIPQQQSAFGIGQLPVAWGQPTTGIGQPGTVSQ